MIKQISIVLLLVILAGCGTRRVNVQVEKAKIEQKEESSSVGNVSKISNSSEEGSIKEQNAKTDEKQEHRITELFNENGTLKSRITELLNSKSIDNSTKERKSLKTSYFRVDSVFNNINTRYITITTKSKMKNVDADKSLVGNLGGKSVMIWLGVLIIIAVFSYFVIKNKVGR